MIDTIKQILDIFGYISTIIVIVVAVQGTILWFKGILPVLLRLGNRLARGKIAIFAKSDNLIGLENLLEDSGLFASNKILKISQVGNIGRANKASLYLVFWHDWQDEIEKIIEQKNDQIPLIVYAPQELGFIPKDKMILLDKTRNTIVTNFRGRLLNDIIISMITAS